MPRPSRQKLPAPRAYTTRITDFDKFWPEIQSMLELENDLKPYIILEHMLEKHKDTFNPKWKRTLEHKPGDVLAIDFTDLSSLGIRIASEILERNHLVFHATLAYSNWEYCTTSSSNEAMERPQRIDFLANRIASASQSPTLKNLASNSRSRSMSGYRYATTQALLNNNAVIQPCPSYDRGPEQ